MATYSPTQTETETHTHQSTHPHTHTHTHSLTHIHTHARPRSDRQTGPRAYVTLLIDSSRQGLSSELMIMDVGRCLGRLVTRKRGLLAAPPMAPPVDLLNI